MKENTMIGAGIAKNVFRLHRVDGSGESVVRRRLRAGDFGPADGATPTARDLFPGVLVSGAVVAFTAYGAWQNWRQSALWICAMAMAFGLKRSSEKKVPG